ncbi:hypothetical protein GCK32_003515 [Trichostrongylus colubriformis]|uniref:Peptidase M16 N-terminal domain-containing protein n=1 Tax=Trichostrongylus colubriformis TaxID=6319 RepID=A0AAN8F616_TRICO
MQPTTYIATMLSLPLPIALTPVEAPSVSKMKGVLGGLRATHRIGSVLRSCSVATPSVSFQATPCFRSSMTYQRQYCSAQQQSTNVPSKETLFRVDWLLEHLTPAVLKSRLKPFFDICLDDVSFEDKLYNYKFSRKSQLFTHIAKIRLYFRYRSPYNKVERIGSCIYENEDVIVLLWRLSTLESSIWTYFPSFITKREPKINVVEGALDIHVNHDGYVYKIVNRKITASDREGAKVMETFKAEQEVKRKKQEDKELRRQAEALLEQEKHRGTLEHVQQRLVETVPLMFKARLDYTFYRKDVFCDDQIFGVKRYGLDQLMSHLGLISVIGQYTLPHVHMETVSVIPVIEDGTVRCRWRVKYVSIPRLILNPRLFRFDYRIKNLSWYDGYSVCTIDGNGHVFKITIQKTQRDEGMLIDEKSPKDKLAEKIAVLQPRPATTTCVLMFRAGSRYEAPNHRGLVHYLRDSVGTDSANYPGLSLLWSSAVSGGRVSSFSTRDVYGVSLALPRDETSVGISILGHIAQPAFKPWDIEDQTMPALKADNAYKHPYDVAYEDLHRAAYRNGPLARSVYAPKSSIGKISFKTLADFAAKHLTTGQAVLYGVNIEHERMVLYGDSHAPIANGNKVDAAASPYKGGEWRRPAGGSMAHVLLAGEGAPLRDAKAMATQAVLLASLGRSAAVQFSGSAGNAAVLRAVGNCGASAFQAAYEDGGLVGVYIVADGAHVAKAVTSAVSAIKNYKCSDLEAVKRRATNDLLRASAHSYPTSIDRATQILAGLTSEGAILEAIQQVTASDVEAAAKKLSSKFSMSSYGNIDDPVMSQRNEDEQLKPLDPSADGNAVTEDKPSQQTQGFEGFTYNEDVLKFELPPLPDPLPKCKAALEKFTVPKESELVRRSFMPLRTHPDHFIEVYFENVTETGKSRLPWELVRPAFLWKVRSCMDEMVRWHRQREGPDSVDLSEGSENKRMYDFILDKAAKFEAAPFTWQRICELLSSPSRHYRKADKYFRALDKTINVVTTVSEDGRRMTGNPQYISEAPDVYSIEQLFFGDERPDCDFWDLDFAYNAQKVSGSPNTKDQLEPLDMSRKRAYCSDDEVPRSEESDEEMEF